MIIEWIAAGLLGIAAGGLGISVYYLRGTALLNQATAAYRRGDIDGGDRLRQRAQRWTIGAKP